MSLSLAFNRYREDTEVALRSLIMGQGFPLYGMMAYHMGWVDERGDALVGSAGEGVRPALCLLSCEALGGDYRTAMPAAMAVELVYNFSLVHDDIQDGTPERHHRPAVWRIWGPAQAINAGDGMHALARLVLLQQGESGVSPEMVLRAVSLLDEACLRLCEGQYLEITYQERLDPSLDDYLRMMEGRSAALMGCATGLGALMASGSERAIQSLVQFGLKLGLAFQVRADIEELWGPGSAGRPVDISSKRRSLPVVYALQKATGPERRALGDGYSRQTLEPEAASRIIEVLEKTGARDFSQRKADALCREAIQALDDAGVSPHGVEQLGEVARLLVSRDT